MKIGLITFHCSYNFGSALQAYALKTLLNQMGHEVSVVDYRSRDYRIYRLFRFSWPRTMISNVVHIPDNYKRMQSFERFIAKYMNLTRKRYTYRDDDELIELSDQFDCFVCGSDQIWNLDCTHGPVGPYFLDFAGNKRRVAYAPSLAHDSFNDIYFGPAQKKQISEWLSSFSAISVREASTIPLFQPLTDIPIEVCLDPTLLLRAQDYDSISSQVSGAKGTLFVYMLEINDQLVDYAGRLAREMGLTVSYVSKRRLYFGVKAKNYYGVGPSEFLGLVRRSAAVITNSFHATVFSLLFGVPFQTFVTERSGSRMRELLTLLAEEGHLIDGSNMVEPTSVDPERLVSRLAVLRKCSLDFLARALTE